MDTENTVENTQEQATPGDAADKAVQAVHDDVSETGDTQSGGAAPQTSNDEPQRFSFALKKRLEEERPKIAREVEARYAAEIGFAENIRKAFGGMSDEQIINDLTEAQVKAFAKDNGVPESMARRFIELERAANGLVPPRKTSKTKEAPAPESTKNDVWMSRLAKQRQALLDAHGVDVLDGMSEEEEALVMNGETDFQEIFSKRAKGKTPPVNRNTSAANTVVDFDKMSDAEFEAYRRKREGGR